MAAGGKTSISDGLEAARQLFADARVGATRIMLLVLDGEQTVDERPGITNGVDGEKCTPREGYGCITLWDPVCGSDGVTTYSNTCEAEAACQLDGSSAGACKPWEGVTVFAWGLGDQVSLATLRQIATDPSKA
eukprot:scaffold45048_cov53-Phaeocystis_antarctica.AAC.1